MLDYFRNVRDRTLLRRAIRAGLVIGKDVRIMGVPNFGDEPCLVSIGNHVTISTDVLFVTHDGATWVFRHRPGYQGLQRFGRIDIEDNCFIGARVILLPDVRIGRDSIVAAGAVVTKSVPANTVVAGVPSRAISTTDQFIERSAPRCISCPPEVQGDAAAFQALLRSHYPPLSPSRSPHELLTRR